MKSCYVPRDPSVFYKTRDFVMEKRINRETVTANDVLRFLHESGIISMDTDNDGLVSPKEHRRALRNVQNYLTRTGFRRGSRTGAVGLSEKHIALRNEYVRKIAANRALPAHLQKQEVYSDASYIHHHYCRNENSL